MIGCIGCVSGWPQRTQNAAVSAFRVWQRGHTMRFSLSDGSNWLTKYAL